MYNYYFVNLKVIPKMEALAKAEAALAETEKTLNMAIQRLREVEEGVEQLRKLLREEEERKAELEREKQLCEDRMGRAVRLIDGLAGEQIRWTTTVLELNTSLKNAVGDILLASGMNVSFSSFSFPLFSFFFFCTFARKPREGLPVFWKTRDFDVLNRNYRCDSLFDTFYGRVSTDAVIVVEKGSRRRGSAHAGQRPRIHFGRSSGDKKVANRGITQRYAIRGKRRAGDALESLAAVYRPPSASEQMDTFDGEQRASDIVFVVSNIVDDKLKELRFTGK